MLLLLLQVDSDARRILEAVGLKDPNAMVSLGAQPASY
jgi:hypothetical protein